MNGSRGAQRKPTPKNETVSAVMSRMPRASTKPEVALRKALHARGLRFRLHDRRLPGSPDIVLSRARIAVFVDGCFWHGCADHGVLPKNNRAWWKAKLAGNVQRDRRKDAELETLGWVPIHCWEHTPVEEIVERVVTIWKERTGRT